MAVRLLKSSVVSYSLPAGLCSLRHTCGWARVPLADTSTAYGLGISSAHFAHSPPLVHSFDLRSSFRSALPLLHSSRGYADPHSSLGAFRLEKTNLRSSFHFLTHSWRTVVRTEDHSSLGTSGQHPLVKLKNSVKKQTQILSKAKQIFTKQNTVFKKLSEHFRPSPLGSSGSDERSLGRSLPHRWAAVDASCVPALRRDLKISLVLSSCRHGTDNSN